MTLRAIVEVAVDLNHFRNLDLIHQGVYRINISVFNIVQGHRLIANPNMVVEYEASTDKNKTFIRAQHDIADYEILDRENSFSSRSMLIRYSEEKANIKQIAHFRTEVDVKDGYLETPFYVEAKLEFWDMMDIDGPQNWRHALQMRSSINMKEQSKVISVKHFKVSNLVLGISQHLPIIFDGLHYCYVNASIHSALIDFRFRMKPNLMHTFDSFKENGLVVQAHVPISNDKKEKKQFARQAKEAMKQPHQDQSSELDPVFSPSSMTEYFFADSGGAIPPKVSKQHINSIYYDYIKVMYHVHENLRKNMKTWFEELYLNENRILSFKAKVELSHEREQIQKLLVPIDQLLPEYVTYGIREMIEGKEPKTDVLIANHLKGGEFASILKVEEELLQEEEEVKTEQLKSEDSTRVTIFSEDFETHDEVNQETGHTSEGNRASVQIIPTQSGKASKGLDKSESANKRKKIDDLKVKLTPEQAEETKEQDMTQRDSEGDIEELPYSDQEECNLDESEEQPESLMLASQEQEGPIKIAELGKLKVEEIKMNDDLRKSSFAEYVETESAAEATTLIQNDINKVGGQLFQMWFKWVTMLRKHGDQINEQLKSVYDQRIYNRFLESIFKSVSTTPNLGYCGNGRLGELHKSVARDRRTNPTYLHMNPLPVHDISFFPKASAHPVLFEELYTHESQGAHEFGSVQQNLQNSLQVSLPSGAYRQFGITASGNHLFVLVHGFQGNPFDMRVFKACIAEKNPDALFLSSSANEGVNDGDIMEMGVRLAQDVKAFVSEWCPGDELGRISFVGHSLGGLVIRAALPYLEEYNQKMHLYMSLSSPHLGYSFNNNGLVKFGLWILKKFKKNQVMRQLTFADAKDPEDSVLFRLSEMEGLSWFNHIALVSSFQDRYVPFESSRIEVSNKIDKSRQGKGILYRKMVNNIFGNKNFRGRSLYRLDVNFKIQEKQDLSEGRNLDTWIGRAAHILFLENQSIVRMFVTRYRAFFS